MNSHMFYYTIIDEYFSHISPNGVFATSISIEELRTARGITNLPPPLPPTPPTNP